MMKCFWKFGHCWHRDQPMKDGVMLINKHKGCSRIGEYEHEDSKWGNFAMVRFYEKCCKCGASREYMIRNFNRQDWKHYKKEADDEA